MEMTAYASVVFGYRLDQTLVSGTDPSEMAQNKAVGFTKE